MRGGDDDRSIGEIMDEIRGNDGGRTTEKMVESSDKPVAEDVGKSSEKSFCTEGKPGDGIVYLGRMGKM